MSNNNKLLTEGYVWALNKKGQVALSELVNKGFDPDLAFELLNVFYKEEEIYELDGEVYGKEDRED